MYTAPPSSRPSQSRTPFVLRSTVLAILFAFLHPTVPVFAATLLAAHAHGTVLSNMRARSNKLLHTAHKSHVYVSPPASDCSLSDCDYTMGAAASVCARPAAVVELVFGTPVHDNTSDTSAEYHDARAADVPLHSAAVCRAGDSAAPHAPVTEAHHVHAELAPGELVWLAHDTAAALDMLENLPPNTPLTPPIPGEITEDDKNSQASKVDRRQLRDMQTSSDEDVLVATREAIVAVLRDVVAAATDPISCIEPALPELQVLQSNKIPISNDTTTHDVVAATLCEVIESATREIPASPSMAVTEIPKPPMLELPSDASHFKNIVHTETDVETRNVVAEALLDVIAAASDPISCVAPQVPKLVELEADELPKEVDITTRDDVTAALRDSIAAATDPFLQVAPLALELPALVLDEIPKEAEVAAHEAFDTAEQGVVVAVENEYDSLTFIVPLAPELPTLNKIPEALKVVPCTLGATNKNFFTNIPGDLSLIKPHAPEPPTMSELPVVPKEQNMINDVLLDMVPGKNLVTESRPQTSAATEMPTTFLITPCTLGITYSDIFTSNVVDVITKHVPGPLTLIAPRAPVLPTMSKLPIIKTVEQEVIAPEEAALVIEEEKQCAPTPTALYAPESWLADMELPPCTLGITDGNFSKGEADSIVRPLTLIAPHELGLPTCTEITTSSQPKEKSLSHVQIDSVSEKAATVDKEEEQSPLMLVEPRVSDVSRFDEPQTAPESVSWTFNSVNTNTNTQKRMKVTPEEINATKEGGTSRNAASFVLEEPNHLTITASTPSSMKLHGLPEDISHCSEPCTRSDDGTDYSSRMSDVSQSKIMSAVESGRRESQSSLSVLKLEGFLQEAAQLDDNVRTRSSSNLSDMLDARAARISAVDSLQRDSRSDRPTSAPGAAHMHAARTRAPPSDTFSTASENDNEEPMTDEPKAMRLIPTGVDRVPRACPQSPRRESSRNIEFLESITNVDEYGDLSERSLRTYPLAQQTPSKKALLLRATPFPSSFSRPISIAQQPRSTPGECKSSTARERSRSRAARALASAAAPTRAHPLSPLMSRQKPRSSRAGTSSVASDWDALPVKTRPRTPCSSKLASEVVEWETMPSRSRPLSQRSNVANDADLWSATPVRTKPNLSRKPRPSKIDEEWGAMPTSTGLLSPCVLAPTNNTDWNITSVLTQPLSPRHCKSSNAGQEWHRPTTHRATLSRPLTPSGHKPDNKKDEWNATPVETVRILSQPSTPRSRRSPSPVTPNYEWCATPVRKHSSRSEAKGNAPHRNRKLSLSRGALAPIIPPPPVPASLIDEWNKEPMPSVPSSLRRRASAAFAPPIHVDDVGAVPLHTAPLTPRRSASGARPPAPPAPAAEPHKFWPWSPSSPRRSHAERDRTTSLLHRLSPRRSPRMPSSPRATSPSPLSRRASSRAQSPAPRGVRARSDADTGATVSRSDLQPRTGVLVELGTRSAATPRGAQLQQRRERALSRTPWDAGRPAPPPKLRRADQYEKTDGSGASRQDVAYATEETEPSTIDLMSAVKTLFEDEAAAAAAAAAASAAAQPQKLGKRLRRKPKKPRRPLRRNSARQAAEEPRRSPFDDACRTDAQKWPRDLRRVKSDWTRIGSLSRF